MVQAGYKWGKAVDFVTVLGKYSRSTVVDFTQTYPERGRREPVLRIRSRTLSPPVSSGSEDQTGSSNNQSLCGPLAVQPIPTHLNFFHLSSGM